MRRGSALYYVFLQKQPFQLFAFSFTRSHMTRRDSAEARGSCLFIGSASRPWLSIYFCIGLREHVHFLRAHTFS